MNREIKFRVWCNIYKEMKTVEQLGFGGRATIVSGKSFEDIAPVVDYELMQFTGLLDKNGKEIYEGDIVTIEGGRGNMRVTGLIDGSFHITHVKKDEFLLRVSFLKKGCKIIGNIYENPELLFPK